VCACQEKRNETNKNQKTTGNVCRVLKEEDEYGGKLKTGPSASGMNVSFIMM
jgi:hypothetical protein